MKMKARLLTVLVAAGCFSQMAFAASFSSGTIDNKTTATATVTLNQQITLENTLTPVKGLIAGTSVPTRDAALLANGNLKIKEPGVKAQLAVKIHGPGASESVVYATGHEGDPDYALNYRLFPITSDGTNEMDTPDGTYYFTKVPTDNLVYTVNTMSDKLPKAGNYVISATGAVYNR
ncbi:hypothetical protein HFD91_11655 [Enterobacteriaceae bacterium EKM102V]|uniref:hypothetical protein n=1 Tax=Pantoea TaxID=53335 RepID=UPI00142D2D05|nr:MULTISPECIES: hypothetical protein [Pantoea]KAF6660655.1 hypothetical protein HFD91_11655 [Enterobacteriaceae bacterium EKM102V]KAF6669507.1 hypothetical protein HFD97_06355 [Pantoea sp. EKM103V]